MRYDAGALKALLDAVEVAPMVQLQLIKFTPGMFDTLLEDDPDPQVATLHNNIELKKTNDELTKKVVALEQCKTTEVVNLKNQLAF